MKKLDKLILSSFIGPFILTFLVVVFILLTQHMLKYFDDIIGKGLGADVIGQLLFYFAIFMTPIAMPLAVLLSSLIAFGNLGEHFELTAVKSAGISLVRTLLPIFYFVIILTVIAFYVNNTLVPKAALEAYSLLYDIKQKKPALDLREGSFYDGINDMSIKVNKKFSDGKTIKDIIIYDHRKHDGNRDVTTADSGKMYTILNERYLKLELFDGANYSEGTGGNQDISGKKNNREAQTYSRTEFAKMEVVFDLSSFALERTDKKWFQGNRIMRNLGELQSDIDSLDRELTHTRMGLYRDNKLLFTYYVFKDSIRTPEDLQESIQKFGLDSSKMHFDIEAKKRGEMMAREGLVEPSKASLSTEKSGTTMTDSLFRYKIDSLFAARGDRAIYENATNRARTAKNQIEGSTSTLIQYGNDRKVFLIQWHKILASSMACIAMFLIGAPLGAIIKKGGLGVPFLVSIIFFIIYYLLTMTGEKWAKQDIISVQVGVWAADVSLFIVGLLFLRQARLDARLFEADFYMVLFDKLKKSAFLKRFMPSKTAL